ncbi:MAG: hypothetical protein PHC98_03340 [Syntrophotalea acetylenica]|jgi:hypothetical protein|uniref:Uncharacterized protein n=3 Tax=Syntrophotalea TaxID=2812025 RepID=A0A1L3GGB9_SYNAC|nr:hypothetical protein [Syntrophotalea acetylenica]APG25023.1 hypothetical protein A7E75_08345 [Syntrophotalea acetylenica]APG43093.1 hypothetical protein A6070_02315 [Syntrophotalea acetylenica]MDD4456601.1 hypothetical protein [Syntrophotalea acetylenica]
MEIEVRMFRFDDQGDMHPVDKARFDAACEHLEPFVEFKGQCVRLAGALLVRQPDQTLLLQNIYGQYVHFNQEGFVDEEKLAAATRHTDKDLGQDYHNEFMWFPTETEIEKIKAAVGEVL